jgi:multidrug efflux pump subunit AcrA (membrane-fusion protein)
MSLFRLIAPGDGIVEYKKIGWHEQVKIKVGDEVHRGEAIVGIPDFSVMKAMTMVNEADIRKVERGQAVRIRLDAFPNVVINGKVTAVGQVCRLKEQDSKIKVFDVEVLLEDSQSICRPGMTVSCEIITAELPDVLYIAHEYLYEEMGQYYLQAVKGGKTEKVPVKIGPRNNEFVVVYGGVKGGERLVSRSAGEGV